MSELLSKETFSRRFSLEDWQFLCSKPDFLQAVENEEFGQAEVLAHCYLFSLPLSGNELTT